MTEQQTRDAIRNDLNALGVQRGDVVLMHASFKALGPVPGGIETVIQALIETVDTAGTLLMPALSYLQEPRHIHDARHTPCGPHSPLQKMIDYGAKIILLGCGLRMLTALGILVATQVAAQEESRPSVVDEGAALAERAAGYSFVEGPAIDATGALFFTDLGNGTINVLGADGNTSVYRSSRADAANGLAFDGQGRLYACEGGSGRITRTDIEGNVAVLATQFAGARFNSPNDLALTGNGSVYFTDPFFGSSASQPQPITGVYHIGADGEVALVIDDLNRPNGIALSADESVLYVSNDGLTGVGEIWAFDVLANGSLANKHLFATAARVMDGMALDAQGNLYATSFNQGRSSAGRGVWVFAPNGDYLGLIATPEQPTNCTIANGILYITASTRVFSIALNTTETEITMVQQATWAQIKTRSVR